MTPQCGVQLEVMAEYLSKKSLFSLLLMKSKIPVKNRSTRPMMWSIAWPHWYALHPDLEQSSPKELFLKHLAEFSVPWGSEDKYANTIEYFDTVYREDGASIEQIKKALKFEFPA
jgi:hypothetical protein